MDPKLNSFIRKNYKDSCADLFAVFMEVASNFVKDRGFISLINQHVWMFLSSFERLRISILDRHQIYSMVHLGTRAFSEIGGEVVQTTTFVLRKERLSNYIVPFIRLTEIEDAEKKAKQFYNINLLYYQIQEVFNTITGAPIAYWASKRVIDVFSRNETLGDEYTAIRGLETGNNKRFLKNWFEVSFDKICLNSTKQKELSKKWFPYNKGGGFRRWY